ncbi:MAG: hypothetical protein ACE5ER_01645 [Nitrospinaceae bacterium]
MPEKEKLTSWWDRLHYRLWGHRSLKEKKRFNSLIVLALYTFGFLYFVLYLSILNSVNRHKTGTKVKSWYGGDTPAIVQMRQEQEREIQASYKQLRKPVSGGL